MGGSGKKVCLKKNRKTEITKVFLGNENEGRV